jgi:hypothetical protein
MLVSCATSCEESVAHAEVPPVAAAARECGGSALTWSLLIVVANAGATAPAAKATDRAAAPTARVIVTSNSSLTDSGG